MHIQYINIKISFYPNAVSGRICLSQTNLPSSLGQQEAGRLEPCDPAGTNMKFHGTENTQNVINVHFLVKCLHKTNMNFKRSSCHVLCISPGSISRIT